MLFVYGSRGGGTTWGGDSEAVWLKAEKKQLGCLLSAAFMEGAE